ncbi:MAG: response regulator, partial [bacterium]|nr:response regulator [bacterium]
MISQPNRTAPNRILAVDDVAANLLILDELLGDEYELICCESGDKAIELAPKLRPDLILLDIMMPGLDGYETCRQLRAMRELESAKIIMVSAKARIEDRLKGYEVGANDYLSKPFDHGELLAKVNVYLQLKSVEEINVAKSRVIEVLQHSGRTPLTPIIGNAELLAMDDVVTDEMRVTLANSIHRCGNRLLKLFSKAEHWAELVSGMHQMAFRKLNIGDLFHYVIDEMEPSKQQRIQINTGNAASTEIHGDAAELRIAISAMLHNALRFSPEDATVDLTARVESGFVAIEVTDRGPGF